MITPIGPAIEGFTLGIGLILAIGAQNAFVLRQGIERQHVLTVCLICALSDAALIAAGVAGFGATVTALPWLPAAMAAFGAIFLFWYGVTRFRAALKPEALTAAGTIIRSRATVISQCLAFTWLNPHVYLDTVVLVGGASLRHAGMAKLSFAAGAMTSSFVFFFSLGLLARLLAPWLARPAVWRWIEVGIGCLMWLIAAKLVFFALEHQATG